MPFKLINALWPRSSQAICDEGLCVFVFLSLAVLVSFIAHMYKAQKSEMEVLVGSVSSHCNLEREFFSLPLDSGGLLTILDILFSCCHYHQLASSLHECVFTWHSL